MPEVSTKVDFFSFVSFLSLWLLDIEKALMENIAEVLQGIAIGLFVATFLLKTNRVLKAIELCRECLIFLNHKALNKEKEFVKAVRIFIHTQIFMGYDVISYLTSAIQYGEYVKAEEYLQKALVITKEIGDKQGEASFYGNLGIVFRSLGEYVKAEEYLQKALVIRKEIGDKQGEAADYGNLGTVFQSLGEYVKAEEYLQKALVIRNEIKDKKGEASSYGNLGTVFQSLGEYVKADEYHQKALVIRKEIGD